MPSTTTTCLFIASLVCLQSLVQAHFTMIYPESRGFAEANEAIAPCGGYDTPSENRFRMPRSGFVTIDSGHPSYSYQINALFGDNPTAADFTEQNLQKLSDGQRSYPQEACLPFQFGADVQDNALATLQIVYNGGDGLLYQCIDIVVDNNTNIDQGQCRNADGTAPNPIDELEAKDENKGLSSATASLGFVALAAIALSMLFTTV